MQQQSNRRRNNHRAALLASALGRLGGDDHRITRDIFAGAAAAAAPMITRSRARELVRAEACSEANNVMCHTMWGMSDQRGKPE